MRRMMAAVACLCLIASVGCAVVSSEKIREGGHEEYTFRLLGFPLYRSRGPVEPAERK